MAQLKKKSTRLAAAKPLVAPKAGRPVLPKTLKIGPYDYKTVWMSKDEAEKDKLDGCWDRSKRTISLDEQLEGVLLAVVFLHEVLHAIHDVCGLSDESSEDNYAHGCANGLVAFARDNPEAWAWYNALLSEQLVGQKLDTQEFHRKSRARKPKSATRPRLVAVK